MAASMNVNVAVLVTLSYVFVHFVDATTSMPRPCHVKETTLTCTGRVSVEMKFKLCRHKPTVVIKIDVDEHDFHFRREYVKEESTKSDINIPVRKVTEESGMLPYITWGIGNVELSMKADGHGKGEISVTGLADYSGLVEEDSCSGFEYWFNSQSILTLKYIGSAILTTLTAFGSFCFFAFCRRRRSQRRSAATEGGESLIPVRDSNVSYERLDNNGDDVPAILPSRDWVS